MDSEECPHCGVKPTERKTPSALNRPPWASEESATTWTITGIAMNQRDALEDRASFEIGKHGVTSIDRFEQSSPFGPIPYLRVWRGKSCLMELGQHEVYGVYWVSSRTPHRSRPGNA